MHANIISSLACVTAFFDGRGFAEHHFNRLWSVSENANNGKFVSNYEYLFILKLFRH